MKKYFIGNETYDSGNEKLNIWVGKLVEFFKIIFSNTYATDNAKLSALEAELREYFKNLSEENLVIVCAKLKVYFKIHKIYKRDTYANGNANNNDNYYYVEYQKLKKEINDLRYASDNIAYAKERKMSLFLNKLNELLAKCKLQHSASSNYYKSILETYYAIERDLVEKMMYFDEKLLDIEDRIFYDERKLDEFYDDKKWRRDMNGLYNTR